MILDNFAVSAFQTCPAKYHLRISEGWVPVRKKASLGFGAAIHSALAEWYRTKDLEAALTKLHESWPQGMPVEDWRTLDKAEATIRAYVNNYLDESFNVVGDLVECAFTLDTGLKLNCNFCGCAPDEKTGRCSVCQEECEPLVYGGVIDAVVEFGSKLYILEHKTTSVLGNGDYFFMQFKPNNQITGYVWAVSQLTSKKVGGAIINAIGVTKSSPPRFERRITGRSESEVSEWLKHLQFLANEIKLCERTGMWPWRTASCTLYGLCDYHDVHVLATATERAKRLEQDYVIEPWNYEERDE